MEAGVSLGFKSLEDEVRVDSLPVEGELPDWLTGSLIRTGPSKFEVGDRTMNHWFDGLAMLHRFSFEEGDVSYASRFLESNAYRAATAKGEITYAEFATDPCRSLFKRAMSMFQPGLSDNNNVNLLKLGERFVAMTETPLPIEFDPETLKSAGVAWDVPGLLTTAHPHLDSHSGGMLNYAVKFGRRSEYRFFSLGPASDDDVKVISSTVTKQPAYMHSFGLTENWIVLAEYPFVVNPPALVFSGRPFIENFKWKPDLGTRFTLIDRKTGEETGPFVTDPCFAFHHVNAFESDAGQVVADICTFDDAEVVQSLYLDNLRSGGPIPAPTLTRFTITPAAGTVDSERLIEESLELPRINYGLSNTRPYRFAWGLGTNGTSYFDRIVAADLETRTSKVWREPGCWPGEPVFASRPGGTDEADGVLLSVVLDTSAETSFLLVLDAKTLEERARATVPHHIPFSFHGQYVR